MVTSINNYLAVRYMILVLTVFLFLVSEPWNLQAQSSLSTNKITGQDDSLLRYSVGIPNCESARRNIEMMIEKIDKPNETNIFAIIRLAKNERSNVYAQRKLAVDRLLQRLYKSLGGNYIIAESDRAKERNGRIEFYVEGRIYMIYETAPNINRICSN